MGLELKLMSSVIFSVSKCHIPNFRTVNYHCDFLLHRILLQYIFDLKFKILLGYFFYPF